MQNSSPKTRPRWVLERSQSGDPIWCLGPRIPSDVAKVCKETHLLAFPWEYYTLTQQIAFGRKTSYIAYYCHLCHRINFETNKTVKHAEEEWKLLCLKPRMEARQVIRKAQETVNQRLQPYQKPAVDLIQKFEYLLFQKEKSPLRAPWPEKTLRPF